MDNSIPQKEVAEQTFNNPTEQIHVTITDNEHGVIITADEVDAVYTADEARQFAETLVEHSHEEWGTDENDVIAEYIKDMANIVDGLKDKSHVMEKWE